MSYNLVDPKTGDLTRVAGGTLYADVPVGTILSFSGTSVPAGYLLCDGREVSRIDYSNLFTVIGTTFGAGDGSTTFNLPNLVNKFIEGTQDDVGQTLNAGLPNISAGFAAYTYQNGSPSGKIKSTITNTNQVQQGGGSDRTFVTFNLDASRDSVVYGKSDTVQPPAVKMLYIIKAMSASLPFDFTEYVRNLEFKSMDTGDADQIRSFAEGKLYSLKVSAPFNVVDDAGTSYQIPSFAEATFFKHSGDLTVQFHSYYGTSGIWEVFYNSNGQTRGKKIV